MYSDVSWVLVSSWTQVQPLIILDPDYLPDYLSISPDYNISKYNPLAGSSYIKLPKELEHPRKGLINVQNIDDNQCFKLSIVRYLNPRDHNPRRITKVDKDFAKKLDFKDIQFPVKIRNTHKIEKKNSNGISAFGFKNKEKIQSMYQKMFWGKTCWLIIYKRRRKETLCSYQWF